MSVELPKDAEGREIPLDTNVLYDANGSKRDVKSFIYCVDDDVWRVLFLDSIASYVSTNVHLTPPDSWKKLEEDLRRGADALSYEACAYFGKSACDCSSCIADKGETCERVVMRDIADRIRKLRGEGDA